MTVKTRRQRRLQRAVKLRKRLNTVRKPRITVIRSNKNVGAQLIDASGDFHRVVYAVSSISFKEEKLTRTEKAKRVGELIGKKALELGYTELAFDRSGFRYHGVIQALAEGAREHSQLF